METKVFKEKISSFLNVVRNVVDLTAFGRLFHQQEVVKERVSDLVPFCEGISRHC